MAGLINDLKKCLSIGLVFFAATLFTACSTYKTAGAGASQDSGATAQFNFTHQEYLNYLDKAVPYDQSVVRSRIGSYLAGRHAQHNSDWKTATQYLMRSLKSDPDNIMLLQRGFIMALGSGKSDIARALSREIIRLNDNPELSLIFMATDAMSRDDFESAQAFLDAIPDNSVGRYTKPMLSAWAYAGMGKLKEAHKELKKMPRNTSDFDNAIYNLHEGMLYEFAREDQRAAKSYGKIDLSILTLRSAYTIAGFYEHRGQPDKARAIYKALRNEWDDASFIDAALERLDRGQKSAFYIKSARDGALATLFDLGNMLYQQDAIESALVYSRMAKHLAPDSPFTSILLGDVLSVHGRYDEATQQYRSVSPGSDLYWASRLRASEMLERSGRHGEALEILTNLAAENNSRSDVYVYIGDLYRRHEDFSAAVEAYDQAFDRIPEVTEQHWGLLYARGIALERTNQWERAEADLLRALDFRPDHPLVLNYLGYSWAEQGINLDRALDMVERAVILRPDDGYIIDSLGWVLYRMGYYEQAVPLLERASEMLPNDSTINDHLGDAYWQVERKREARFQWHRALGMTKKENERDMIRQKLANGLPHIAHQTRVEKTKTAGADQVESMGPATVE